ncbi:LamB/YcsF family protein [Cellulomonas fimi]|uniref:5-oxoprolinase subunit A n=1 Tax=Cellulomonas fimi TaxID=1708 RepID=A0A7Y0QGW5_CELFI|nr:5-oxoprolinase subunit PxpA [Cellulomonas fimi]NMR19274.1 LamB/YcsF family protein [Cellulomonas fimi]
MSIDLNSDVGESFGQWTMGDDASIMKVVSSANVACGFHAGDPITARRTCTAAAESGVHVGAHVAYRDLAGFGRRFMDVDPVELTNEVIYQIGALQAIAAAAGTSVTYVKPHGALYNTIAHHREQAHAVVEAIRTVDDSLPILCLPASVIQAEAEKAGLRAVVEAFADRAYNADGTLVSRRLPGSVIHDPDVVAARVVRMATERTVKTIDGQVIDVDAESVCVHGDTAGAVAIATAVRAGLEQAGVPVTSFL